MLTVTDSGLFCAAGGFHIDPWRGVERALITHAHSDHARSGSAAYLCASAGVGLLRSRLGGGASIQGHRYGESLDLDGVKVSFHPAGHVLGAAQIRVEHRGEVWVVSGDYKRQGDATCASFEVVPCHTFVTESTFGLPVYRWPDPAQVFSEINAWWQSNQAEERTSILFGYSLGKAQRLLAGVDASLGPILVHRSIQELLPIYVEAGVTFPVAAPATKEAVRAASGRALVIAPPAVNDSEWLNSLGDISTGFASGWMLVRGTRRRHNADRGFVLSDHADWPALIQTIRETGARRILVTHGATGPMVRWLREQGWQADSLRTQFHGDAGEESSPTAVRPVDEG